MLRLEHCVCCWQWTLLLFSPFLLKHVSTLEKQESANGPFRTVPCGYWSLSAELETRRDWYFTQLYRANGRKWISARPKFY